MKWQEQNLQSGHSFYEWKSYCGREDIDTQEAIKLCKPYPER